MSPIDPDLEARLDDLYQRREAEAQSKAVDASRSVETKTFATAAEASKFAGEVGASDDGTARGATVRRTPDGTWVAERKAAKRSVPVVDVDPESFAKEQARDFLAKFPDAPDAYLEQFREWADRRKAIGAVRVETRAAGDKTGYDLLPAGAKAAAIGIAGLDAVARPLSAGLSDVAVKAVAGEEGVKNLREMEAGVRKSNPVLVGGIEAAGALAGTLASPVMRGATKGAQAVGLGPVAASGVGFGVHSAAMQGAREITGDAAGEAGTPFQRILLSGADGALKGAAIAKVTPWLTKAGEAVAGRFVPGLGKAATEARIRVAAAIEQAGQNVVMEFLPTIDATGVRATGPGSAAEFGTQVVLGALFGAGTKQRFSDVFRRELGKAGLTPEQADALAPALAEALDATKDTPPDPALMAEVEKATAVPPSADPAAATAVLKDAVEKGLVKPEEIASPERVAEYRQSEYEARRDGATPEQAAAFATARVEAMPPETRPDGTVAAPTMPTREALDAGLIEGPARPIVEKIVAEGGDTVSSGVGADGRPFAVGVDARGETIVVRGDVPAKPGAAVPPDIDAMVDSGEYVFHGTSARPGEAPVLREGTYFAPDPESALYWAQTKHRERNYPESERPRVFAVRKADIAQMSADPNDPFGAGWIESGAAVRSSKQHSPAFEVPEFYERKPAKRAGETVVERGEPSAAPIEISRSGDSRTYKTAGGTITIKGDKANEVYLRQHGVVEAPAEAKPDRGYPADWDTVTPEAVGAELDSPEAARASRPDMGEAGFADVAGLGAALARPLRAAYESINTTTAPNITRESPRARDSARALAGTESTRDAIGMYLKEEVKRRGIDPEKAGAVYVEDNLRGIEDQRIAESRKHEEAARALRAELDDVRRDIADEAADHVDRVTTEATSAADRAKIKASYVLAETQRRAEDSVKAASQEARDELKAAREARDAAIADVVAERRKAAGLGRAARKGTGEGRSLSEWVRAEGGIDYQTEAGQGGGWTGELDRLRKKGSGTTGLVRVDGKGRTLDEMHQQAVRAGYLPEDSTLSDFIDAVEMDATGRGRVLSAETTDFADFADAQFREWADREAQRAGGADVGPPKPEDAIFATIRDNYRAMVEGIKRRARAVRKAADAEVERARADLKRTNTETRHEVETAVMRAEAKAQREKDRAERSRKYEVDPATGKRRLVRRSMDELLRYTARAETDAAQALVDAAKVKSLIGPGQPFATRADYEAARDDPAFKAFTEEVVKPLRARFDKDYRDSQGVADNVDLPTRGRELGVRMNLVHGDQPTMFEAYGGRKAPEDAKPGGTKAGADGNMRLSKSPFAHRASGQADSYNTNAVDLLLNSYQRGAENANKHRFFRDLVADGNAVFVKKGQTPPTEIRGEPAVKSVVEIPALGGREARSLYVRESMAGEIRRLVLAEKAVEGPAFVRAVNAVSVSSTVGDSFANMGNALGAVFGRQSLGIHPAAETALRLAGRADVLLKAVKLVKTFATVNRPENLLRIVDDATKGGMRDYSRSRAEPGSKNPLAWLSHFAGRLDRSARVMASKAYDRLAANGHIANPSPTSKADFLQKSGQYQRRAMGAFTRAGIETGLTPFVVAGKARLARGVDTALGNTGIRDAGMKMRAYGLAQSAASWAGTAGLAYAITYALTGKPPRDEVPLFTIDTGKNNEDGSPQFWDLARFVGQSDAMRVFGTRGYIEARRRGLSHELALDSAVEAGQSAWAALVRGPIPNAASIAAFGHPIGGNGRKTTEPAFSSEETEFDNRWGAAIDSIAPTWRLIPAATGGSLAEWANVDTSFWEEARKQLSYFAVQSGMSAEKIASLPERIEFARGAEAVNWIRKKMYEVPHEKRAEWVDRQLERITDPGTRAFAAKKLRRPLAEALRDKGDD